LNSVWTKPEQIKGTLVILPILNIEGFSKRGIYIMPQDGKNLNRMFPGVVTLTAHRSKCGIWRHDQICT
jgi:predicted deacylase